MKKFNLKAFTLVEMLIVIVIIGILIAALLPRMQAAQGRARDVARKTALSQIQSAIVTYQGDTGQRPHTGSLATDSKNEAVTTDTVWLEDILKTAGMTDVPKDPLAQQSFGGLGGATSSSGGFLYMVSERNGTTNGGFILMAKTEVPGGSNWVICSGDNTQSGNIAQGVDLADVHPCRDVQKGDTCKNENKGETCEYGELSELRYIVLY